VRSTASALASLGVSLQTRSSGEVIVHGVGLTGLQEPAGAIDCGNSGTTLRLLAGVVAGQSFETTLTGDQSLCGRPMARIVEPLRLMGAQVEAADDGRRAPLRIRGGRLDAIEHVSRVSSAQVKSCVLLAGLQATGRTVLWEPSQSRDHTERMLSALGVHVERVDGGVAVEGGQPLQVAPEPLQVPGDLSAAAFLAVAGAALPGSDLRLMDVGVNPTRTGFLDVLEQAGIDVERGPVVVSGGEPRTNLRIRSGPLAAFELKGALVPRLIDEIPILAILAARAQGTTRIVDAGELRAKESDRIRTTVNMLRTFGVNVLELPDGLVIDGMPDRPLCGGGSVDAAGDHRIAMAAVIGALMADAPTHLIGARAVDVSFPGFFQTLETCQAG